MEVAIVNRALLIVLVMLGMVASLCPAQRQKSKPLPVSFSVETEGQNIAWPAGMREVGRMDLGILKYDITQALLKDKAGISLVDEKAPGTQLHVNIVVAQLQDRWYVASSALEFGDEKSTGLLSHHVLVQPSLEQLANNVAFQVEGFSCRRYSGF
jgi:hypothetical protein